MKKVEKKVKKVGGGGEWNKLTRPIGVPSPSSRVERGTTELRKEVYEPTYDGYFKWVSDTGREYPMIWMQNYAKIVELQNELSNRYEFRRALGEALASLRISLFDQIREYVQDVAGQGRGSTQQHGSSARPPHAKTSSRTKVPFDQVWHPLGFRFHDARRQGTGADPLRTPGGIEAAEAASIARREGWAAAAAELARKDGRR